MEWLLADAKNKLSEVVTRAVTEGPQRIKRRNDRVVLLSQEEYDRLTEQKVGLKSFLLNESPDLSSLEISRDHSPMRQIDL